MSKRITPGPWNIESVGIITGADETLVAFVRSPPIAPIVPGRTAQESDAIQAANSYLIASAPVMFDTLHAIANLPIPDTSTVTADMISARAAVNILQLIEKMRLHARQTIDFAEGNYGKIN